MSLVILHVGMPKTGTTTIQATLDRNAGSLADAGILYPAAGRYAQGEPCHHAFFFAASSRHKALRTSLPAPDKTLSVMVQEIRQEQMQSGAGTLVLSSEMVWSPVAFDIAALERVRDLFPGAAFVVLAYLRPIESHAISGYAQRVSGQQLYDKSFKTHLQEADRIGRYDFEARLAQFAQVFGEAAIRPVWMPDLKGDLLAPFSRIDPAFAALQPEPALNERKSWFYVAAARRLNMLNRLGMSSLCHRGRNLILRLDSFFKNRPALDRRFAPCDQKTLAMLEDRTRREYAALRQIYDL